jgi:hypothetical protein
VKIADLHVDRLLSQFLPLIFVHFANVLFVSLEVLKSL